MRAALHLLGGAAVALMLAGAGIKFLTTEWWFLSVGGNVLVYIALRDFTK